MDFQKQLNVLEQSKGYIVFFIIAIVLSYLSTDIQEKQLLCANQGLDCSCLPDTCPMRLTSGLLVLWALIFFYTLAADTLRQPAADAKGRKAACLGYTASLLNLISGILRLYLTAESCRAPSRIGNSAEGTAEEIVAEDDV